MIQSNQLFCSLLLGIAAFVPILVQTQITSTVRPPCDGGDIVVQCPPPIDNRTIYLPFPYDCRKFVQCSNGVPIVQCCPPQTVWNNTLQTCAHETQTDCVIVTTPNPGLPTTTVPTSPPTTTPPTSMPTTTTEEIHTTTDNEPVTEPVELTTLPPTGEPEEPETTLPPPITEIPEEPEDTTFDAITEPEEP